MYEEKSGQQQQQRIQRQEKTVGACTPIKNPSPEAVTRFMDVNNPSPEVRTHFVDDKDCINDNDSGKFFSEDQRSDDKGADKHWETGDLHLACAAGEKDLHLDCVACEGDRGDAPNITNITINSQLDGGAFVISNRFKTYEFMERGHDSTADVELIEEIAGDGDNDWKFHEQFTENSKPGIHEVSANEKKQEKHDQPVKDYSEKEEKYANSVLEYTIKDKPPDRGFLKAKPSEENFVKSKSSVGNFVRIESSERNFVKSEPSRRKLVKSETSVGKFVEPRPSVEDFVKSATSAEKFVGSELLERSFIKTEPFEEKIFKAKPSEVKFVKSEPSGRSLVKGKPPDREFIEPKPSAEGFFEAKSSKGDTFKAKPSEVKFIKVKPSEENFVRPESSERSFARPKLSEKDVVKTKPSEVKFVKSGSSARSISVAKPSVRSTSVAKSSVKSIVKARGGGLRKRRRSFLGDSVRSCMKDGRPREKSAFPAGSLRDSVRSPSSPRTRSDLSLQHHQHLPRGRGGDQEDGGEAAWTGLTYWSGVEACFACHPAEGCYLLLRAVLTMTFLSGKTFIFMHVFIKKLKMNKAKNCANSLTSRGTVPACGVSQPVDCPNSWSVPACGVSLLVECPSIAPCHPVKSLNSRSCRQEELWKLRWRVRVHEDRGEANRPPHWVHEDRGEANRPPDWLVRVKEGPGGTSRPPDWLVRVQEDRGGTSRAPDWLVRVQEDRGGAGQAPGRRVRVREDRGGAGQAPGRRVWVQEGRGGPSQAQSWRVRSEEGHCVQRESSRGIVGS